MGVSTRPKKASIHGRFLEIVVLTPFISFTNKSGVSKSLKDERVALFCVQRVLNTLFNRDSVSWSVCVVPVKAGCRLYVRIDATEYSRVPHLSGHVYQFGYFQLPPLLSL